jgi:hypothetical protein
MKKGIYFFLLYLLIFRAQYNNKKVPALNSREPKKIDNLAPARSPKSVDGFKQSIYRDSLYNKQPDLSSDQPAATGARGARQL